MPKIVAALPQKPEGYLHPKPALDRVIRNITFFGDSSISEGSQIYREIYDLAKLLAESGFAVVNGGGPGVMKAATDGAESVEGHTVGVFWEPKLASIFEGKNLANITDESQTYSNYMMRTLGLIEHGHVYIVCKGGTGTISEFGMVWALAKLYFGRHKPVILYGEFWRPLIESIQEHLLIDDNELGVLHYATTKEEVLDLLQAFEVEVQSRVHKTYSGDETPFVLAPRFGQDYADYLEHTKVLHKNRVANKVTEKQLNEFVELVQPPARILDIGCGAGYDLSFLADHYSVTAIDNDPEMLRIARFENPNADILEMDIRSYEIQENVFKGIWSRDILQHLNDEEFKAVMTKLARGLVPGGVLYMITREGEGEGTEIDVEAGQHVEKYYNYFTESELIDSATNAGLEVVKVDRITRSHNWLAGVFRKP
jgi:hypothetical protein